MGRDRDNDETCPLSVGRQWRQLRGLLAESQLAQALAGFKAGAIMNNEDSEVPRLSPRLRNSRRASAVVSRVDRECLRRAWVREDIMAPSRANCIIHLTCGRTSSPESQHSSCLRHRTPGPQPYTRFASVGSTSSTTASTSTIALNGSPATDTALRAC